MFCQESTEQYYKLVTTLYKNLPLLFTCAITKSQEELEQLHRELRRSKSELQLLQESTEKWRRQLDSLDTQLEQEIASRRLEIKV